MKIKTGLKAGNTVDDARRAISKAGVQVSNFVNAASVQAGGVVDGLGSAWRSLTGKKS
jgi:hypothetical protein